MGESRVHFLIVTGPLRERLYERFVRLYRNSSDVQVIMDRRHAERRRAARQRDDERRREDRRRRGGDWVFPSGPT